MSTKSVETLLECMKNIVLTGNYSEKEIKFCKELYSEVSILCLGKVAKSEREDILKKSGIKMLEKDAMLAIKIRIKNLIESEL